MAQGPQGAGSAQPPAPHLPSSSFFVPPRPQQVDNDNVPSKGVATRRCARSQKAFHSALGYLCNLNVSSICHVPGARPYPSLSFPRTSQRFSARFPTWGMRGWNLTAVHALCRQPRASGTGHVQAVTQKQTALSRCPRHTARGGVTEPLEAFTLNILRVQNIGKVVSRRGEDSPADPECGGGLQQERSLVQKRRTRRLSSDWPEGPRRKTCEERSCERPSHVLRETRAPVWVRSCPFASGFCTRGRRISGPDSGGSGWDAGGQGSGQPAQRTAEHSYGQHMLCALGGGSSGAGPPEPPATASGLVGGPTLSPRERWELETIPSFPVKPQGQ